MYVFACMQMYVYVYVCVCVGVGGCAYKDMSFKSHFTALPPKCMQPTPNHVHS